jgi:hypothetical protein
MGTALQCRQIDRNIPVCRQTANAAETSLQAEFQNVGLQAIDTVDLLNA